MGEIASYRGMFQLWDPPVLPSLLQNHAPPPHRPSACPRSRAPSQRRAPACCGTHRSLYTPWPRGGPPKGIPSTKPHRFGFSGFGPPPSLPPGPLPPHGMLPPSSVVLTFVKNLTEGLRRAFVRSFCSGVHKVSIFPQVLLFVF